MTIFHSGFVCNRDNYTQTPMFQESNVTMTFFFEKRQCHSRWSIDKISVADVACLSFCSGVGVGREGWSTLDLKPPLTMNC